MNNTDLILVASKRMDANKKPDRDETRLIRMSAGARKAMKMANGKEVDLWAAQKAAPVTLEVFQAFTTDMRDAEESGHYTAAELRRIAFVTTDNFNAVVGGEAPKKKNDWQVKHGFEPPLLGADPEFMLRTKDGTWISANGVAHNWSKKTPMGYDGAMAEIRPEPSKRVDGLVANINKIFKDGELTGPIENMEWLAGCLYEGNGRNYPIAGHFHFGNLKQIEEMSEHFRYAFFRVLNKILDELLALPLIKLDGTCGKTRRTACTYWAPENWQHGYGYFGEWRPANGRFEYRTLSGMWLWNPFVAKAVIGTARAITEEVYRHCAERGYDNDFMAGCGRLRNKKQSLFKPGFDEWDDIELAAVMGCTHNTDYMIKRLNDSDPSKVTAAFLKSWYDKMRKMSTYKKYGKHIDALNAILRMPLNKINNHTRVIQTNWLEGKKFPIEA
jgi:hypothetical protein